MTNQTDNLLGQRKRPSPPRVLIQFHLRATEAEALRKLPHLRDVPQTVILREALGKALSEAGL